MHEASKYFWSYTEAHQGVYKRLVEMRSTLESARKKYRIEALSIDENRKLGKRFSRLIGDIDRYEHLRIQDLRNVEDRAGGKALGMVFAGAVTLYLASEVEFWEFGLGNMIGR